MDHVMRQISIFAENRPGRLAAIADALEEEGINIHAFSIAEAGGFGIIRALVSDPDRTLVKLTDLGYVVSITEVIGVRMRDEPGGLRDIARILGSADINIEYAYAYSGRNEAVLVIRVDRIDIAIDAIRSHGGELMKGTELA